MCLLGTKVKTSGRLYFLEEEGMRETFLQSWMMLVEDDKIDNE